MKLYITALLMLLAFYVLPAKAQQVIPPQNKLINVACGPLQSLVDYLNSEGFELVFMGETPNAIIYDSLWLSYDRQRFHYIRANKNNGEGCIVAPGMVAYSEFLQESQL